MKIIGFTRGEVVGNPECPVMTRTVLALGAFSLRLHHFAPDHEDAHPHSHPWWFATLVLGGSYEDVSPDGIDRLGRGAIRLRPSRHTHRTRVGATGCRTIIVTGPASHDWGFWVKGRYFPWNLYRNRFPAPPCAPTPEDGVSIEAKTEPLAGVATST